MKTDCDRAGGRSQWLPCDVQERLYLASLPVARWQGGRWNGMYLLSMCLCSYNIFWEACLFVLGI